jgi:hypothetical protein
VQDDRSLGPGRFLLVLFALSLLVLLVFASRVSAQEDGTTATSPQGGDAGGETTADTSSASPSSASASADPQAQTADSVDRSADAFRCDFFLRVVRDDGGNVRHQYRDDELIVRRFEQCLSEDVIADTIVNRKLPDTGGVPLLVPGVSWLSRSLGWGFWWRGGGRVSSPARSRSLRSRAHHVGRIRAALSSAGGVAP